MLQETKHVPFEDELKNQEYLLTLNSADKILEYITKDGLEKWRQMAKIAGVVVCEEKIPHDLSALYHYADFLGEGWIEEPEGAVINERVYDNLLNEMEAVSEIIHDWQEDMRLAGDPITQA